MEYRQLGNAGLRVSVIGLGTNQFGGKVEQEGVNAIIAAALDMGINFIDTADVYQEGRSEETLGVALKGQWDKAVLATKVGITPGGPREADASRQHIIAGVEASLRRLQTDHIDLYQMHRWDDETPIEETMRALEALVQSGKVRYIGASNYTAQQLKQANALAAADGWARFVTIQNHYHMLEREIEAKMLPYCATHTIGVLPYFPLAGGFLTGKYKRGQPAPAGSRGETSQYVQKYMTGENFDKIEHLTAWAAMRSHTLNELAHAWLLAHPPVSSVISGATSVAQVQQNARAADWRLDVADFESVNAVLE
jgi:aryl-alcohol dehydrogenase-like predicted oxidoreductase